MQQTTSADDIFRCIFFLGALRVKKRKHRVFSFQFIIPNASTTYHCMGFQMPDLGGKHHMIHVSILVDLSRDM